jgi:hypothetical protein
VKIKGKYKAIGKAALALLFLLLALGGLFLGLWTMRSSNENLLILNQGERTTGTVISKEVYYASGDHSEDSVTIIYTFTLSSGQEIFGSYRFWPTTVSRFSGIDVGYQLEIAYDPRDPTLNLPVNMSVFNVGNVEDAKKWLIWFPVIVMLLIFGGLAFWFGHKAWEEWKFSKIS